MVFSSSSSNTDGCGCGKGANPLSFLYNFHIYIYIHKCKIMLNTEQIIFHSKEKIKVIGLQDVKYFTASMF